MSNAYVTSDMLYMLYRDGLDALLSSMRRIGISSHEAADAFSAFVYAMKALPEDDEPQESQELDEFLSQFTIN